MKYLLMGVILSAVCLLGSPCYAWDGFDADTADLVEVIPDAVPVPGAPIDVRDYDTEEKQTCLVESVVRNRRTIEVVASCPAGVKRTLVMELR